MKGIDMLSDHKKYSSGYNANLTIEQKIYFRERFSEKSIWKGLIWTASYVASIYLIISIAYFVFIWGDAISLKFVATLLCVLVVSRQMRALENIVHFGSHNNFSRSRKTNDLATNLLAAWPVLQDVRQYRKFHMAHHGDYGSHTDPCKARLESIGADSRDVSTNFQLIRMIIRWMPSYVREFYREVKSDSSQLAIFLVWHLFTCMTIGVLVSWSLAAVIFGTWMFVLFMALPFLRSIAEFSEHDYERADSVCETTFNNLGLLDHVLLHPAGDAWHALHHLHPTVSWWKQGAAHRYLMKHDEAYRQALHRDNLIQDIANFPVSSVRLKLETSSG